MHGGGGEEAHHDRLQERIELAIDQPKPRKIERPQSRPAHQDCVADATNPKRRHDSRRQRTAGGRSADDQNLEDDPEHSEEAGITEADRG